MERARQVVESVEAALCTPMGLRSLAPGEPGYIPHYEGDVWHRDSAYHQGTVWPWLIGPFVEAWVRVRGNSPEVKKLATTTIYGTVGRLTLIKLDLAMYRKLRMRTAVYSRAAARFKLGLWENCSGSIAYSRLNSHSIRHSLH